MTIDTKTLISISEANQNFSKVARLVDECGSAVILKNNVPRYLVIDFSKAEQETTASDEAKAAFEEISIEEHMKRYEDQGIARKEAMKLVAKDRGVTKRDIYQYLLGKESYNDF